MDPLTQGLLGAVTAQLGFRRGIGRDASWVAAAAAVAADLDGFAAPMLQSMGCNGDDLAGLALHRGVSHSLLVVPVIALVFAWPWWRIRRKLAAGRDPPGAPPPFRLLYACTLAAALSHPLLDLLTSYGIQLFAPITDTRYAIDVVAIIDVFYTGILALTLTACKVTYLVRARPWRAMLVAAWIGFALSCAYLAAGRLLHDRAVRIARELAGGETIVRADAYPHLGSILLWRAVVETPDRWIVTRVHHLRDFSADPPRSAVVPKVDNQWTRAARALPEFAVYNWFAMERIRATYARRSGEHVVEFHDMRYSGDPGGVESLWPLRMTFDAAGKVRSVQRIFTFRKRRSAGLIREVWREVWTP